MNPNPIYSTPFLNKIRSYCVKSSYSSSYANTQFISLVPSITDFYYTITSDNLELFSLFPKDICHLIFKDYIPFSLPKDSIYATIVTSILENQVIPEDIFNASLRCKQKCVDCRSYCSNMFVVYNDINIISIILDLPKMFNLEDLLCLI